MKIDMSTGPKKRQTHPNLMWKSGLLAVFMLAGAGCTYAQNAETTASVTEAPEDARVTGLRHLSIHVLELEATLELYREILGFKLVDAQVLQIPGIEGMLVMKLKADDLTIALSLPASADSVGPIGNTNHNHFMLKVNDIGPIGDRLKAAGYALENDNYVQDKYTFFTGPNGEIVGLSSYE